VENCFKETYEAACRLVMPYFQKRAAAALAKPGCHAA